MEEGETLLSYATERSVQHFNFPNSTGDRSDFLERE